MGGGVQDGTEVQLQVQRTGTGTHRDRDRDRDRCRSGVWSAPFALARRLETGGCGAARERVSFLEPVGCGDAGGRAGGTAAAWCRVFLERGGKAGASLADGLSRTG